MFHGVCFLALFMVFAKVHGFLELTQDQISQTDIRALQTRLEEEKEKRILLQNGLDVLIGKFADFERSYHSIEAKSKDSTVAFSASLSKDIHLDLNDRLVLDNVLTNKGGGYDSRHGFFAPPINGTYFFTLTNACVESQISYLELRKNDDFLVHSFTGSSTSSYGLSSTASVTIDLITTDEIWVRCYSDSETKGSNLTALSGYLL